MSGDDALVAKVRRAEWWKTVPSPPPPNAIFTDADGVAGALDVTRRRLRDVRKDPTFPHGRLIAGGGTLRWRLRDVLAWAEAQQAAKFSTIGGKRPGGFGRRDEAGVRARERAGLRA